MSCVKNLEAAAGALLPKKKKPKKKKSTEGTSAEGESLGLKPFLRRGAEAKGI